jgi:hypothetical protein
MPLGSCAAISAGLAPGTALCMTAMVWAMRSSFTSTSAARSERTAWSKASAGMLTLAVLMLLPAFGRTWRMALSIAPVALVP